MYRFSKVSFAKQLSFYLLSALVIAFIMIALALANSLKQFVNNNAHEQADFIAKNALVVFDKQMMRLESIPGNINKFPEDITRANAPDLPSKILKNYSLISSCSVYYNPNYPSLGHLGEICTFRNKDKLTSTRNPIPSYDFEHPDTNQIVKRLSSKGYWISIKINQQPCLSLCAPLYNNSGQQIAVLKIDIPIEIITDPICDYRLYQSGYLFVIDNQGHYITHSDSVLLKSLTTYSLPEKPEVVSKFLNGSTGYTTINKNGEKNFFHFSPIPKTTWRLGIVCPYEEIMNSSDKLYSLLIICMAGGLLFLFISTINIINHSVRPLKQLAYTARQIAKGRFDVKLSSGNFSSEIRELYASFNYMQKSLFDYIERLKITTAEKEQMNSEMRLARKIQQGFLPKPLILPSNIELFAELHQSKEVGGDLYEYFIKDNRLYFAIGDVSGKGIPAALYMASIVKFFRYIAIDKHSTAEICNIINQQTCDDKKEDDDIYITMFMAIMDINTGALTFTNAGHPYPLIIHEDNEISILSEYPDVPIGVVEDYKYSEHTYTLHKNTTIVLYTDGITDSENSKSTFYGKNNLIECIKSVPDKTPEKIIKSILNAINYHTEKFDQSDDLTVLSVLYKGETGEEE